MSEFLLHNKFHRWAWIKRYVQASYGAITTREDLRNIQNFCMFLGYARSGTSLLGGLLDAHPNIAVAHELDVLKYLDARFGKHQIFSLLLENSRSHALRGRKATGYNYEVPGQWQGKFTRLHVIGDKKGGKSSFWLHEKPELLEKLRETLAMPLKVFHVIRNPYDNIATKYRRRLKRGPTTLQAVIDQHFVQCKTVSYTKQRLSGSELFEIRHESMIADPVYHLRAMCDFLGVECPLDYVEQCAGIVFESPHKSRNAIEWLPEDIELVRSKMEPFSFLKGYSYDS